MTRVCLYPQCRWSVWVRINLIPGQSINDLTCGRVLMASEAIGWYGNLFWFLNDSKWWWVACGSCCLRYVDHYGVGSCYASLYVDAEMGSTKKWNSLPLSVFSDKYNLRSLRLQWTVCYWISEMFTFLSQKKVRRNGSNEPLDLTEFALCCQARQHSTESIVEQTESYTSVEPLYFKFHVEITYFCQGNCSKIVYYFIMLIAIRTKLKFFFFF